MGHLCDYSCNHGPLEPEPVKGSERPAPCARSCEANAFNIELRQLRAANTELREKLAAAENAAPEPEWIVNDLGELGVRVAGRHFFLYKGDNIEYPDGLHSDGDPMLCRNVGKREFGETVWPWVWVKQGHSEARYRVELAYTPGLSFGPPDAPEYTWRPLPPTNKTKGS